MLRRQLRVKREYMVKKAELLMQKSEETKPKHYSWLDVSSSKDCATKQVLTNNEKSSKDKYDAENIDSEYRWAGVEDPKIILLTSGNPSASLKRFMKELKYLFPNSQTLNRGSSSISKICEVCLANGVTDLILIHENRGVPSSMWICHLPYGPTAIFTMYDVIMRHDIPDRGTVSLQYPHLIFHNFTSALGMRVVDILKYLFPVPKVDGKRVITFHNHNDIITFRHHMFKKIKKDIELDEIGPRFSLQLYQIKFGTLDNFKIADTQYVLRPYLNTAYKKVLLSEEFAPDTENHPDE